VLKGGGNGRAAARTAPRSTGAGSFHVRKRGCSRELGRVRAARDRQFDWTGENVFLGERRMMPRAGIPLDNQWERWPRITYALPVQCWVEPSTAPRSPVGKGADCGRWGDGKTSGLGTKRNCLDAHGISGAERRPAVPSTLATTAALDPKRKINLCDEVLCRGFLEHDQDAPSEERTKPQAMRNARPQ
jgi:ribosomal protein L37E